MTDLDAPGGQPVVDQAAPPQQQQRAIQPAGELALPVVRIMEVAKRGEVERFESAVVLPEVYQYAISRYGSAPKVMVTSDGYDYINRTMGVQLYQPEMVNDEHGNYVRNPIHRPDYIYLRCFGVWYNDNGQMVMYREDVEVDFKLVYMDARINSKSARVEMDKDGQPVFSESGMPVVKLDASDELKALKALSQLRTFGLRYAHTVAKTRILKTASGVRTLPIQQPRPFAVRVVGYKDNMTPAERIKQAEQDLSTIFGQSSPVEAAGLTPEEMEAYRDIESNDESADFDATIMAAKEATGTIIEPEAQQPNVARRVGPSDFVASTEDSGFFDPSAPPPDLSR